MGNDLNSEKLWCLVYVSSSVSEMTPEDLLDILAVSRARNGISGVTGLLVFEEGHFIQVLEGDRSAVVETFERIKADERHKSISKLLFEPVEERFFRKWDMAFKDQRSNPVDDGGLLAQLIAANSDVSTTQIVQRLFGTFAHLLENCPNR